MEYANLNKTDADKLEKKLKEIEKLQKDFEDIFIDKNFFIKWINFKRARKLHLLSTKKLQELYSGNLD